MSDKDKMERAKTLFGEGDAAFQSGDFGTALTKFEEAYNVYAPSIHVFNINIGLAAYELGDCLKAKTSFQRFLDLVPDHPARGEAQEKLLELERKGCEPPAETEPAPIAAGGSGSDASFGGSSSYTATDDDDAPVLTSSSKERKQQAERERRAIKASKKPMLVAGAVLTGVGVLALAGGGVSMALAIRKRDQLAGFAQPGPTGFSPYHYTNDRQIDAQVFDLDRNKLMSNNYATIALFAVGGAATIAGVALIGAHVAKAKKSKGSEESPAQASIDALPRVVVSPTWMHQGGGAAALVRF